MPTKNRCENQVVVGVRGGREKVQVDVEREKRQFKLKLNNEIMKQKRKREESKHTVRVSACHVNAPGGHNLVLKFHIVRLLLKDIPVVWG